MKRVKHLTGNIPSLKELFYFYSRKTSTAGRIKLHAMDLLRVGINTGKTLKIFY